MKKLINILFSLAFFTSSGYCMEQQVAPCKDEKIKSESEQVLEGTVSTCDDKIVQAYKQIWNEICDYEYLTNKAIQVMSKIKKIQECGCLTGRSIFVKSSDEKSLISTKVGQLFELSFIEAIKKIYEPNEEFIYISAGCGELLADLRLIIALEKAGYKKIKIVLIDNDGGRDEDEEGADYHKFCTQYKKSNIVETKTYLEQFCALVSASNMQTTIIFYDEYDKFERDYKKYFESYNAVFLEIDTHFKFPQELVSGKNKFLSKISERPLVMTVNELRWKI